MPYIPDDLFVEEISVTGAIDKEGRRTYDRKFFVRVAFWTIDSPPLTWGDVPVIRYDPFITPWGGIDPGARALTLNAEPTEKHPGSYIVKVHYGSEDLKWDRGNTSGNPKQSDGSTDPLSRPLNVQFGSTHSTKVMTLDLKNNPVVNSAKQPYNPPLEAPTSNQTINFSMYMPFGDPSTFDPVQKQLYFEDSVNSIALTIPNITNFVYPIGSLRCAKYAPEIVNEGGTMSASAQAYYKVSVECEYTSRPGYWNGLYLDCGTAYIKSMALPPQPLTDSSGNSITAPIPLNGSGQPLMAGQNPYYIISGGGNTQTPVAGQYSYQFYRNADFTQFFT